MIPDLIQDTRVMWKSLLVSLCVLLFLSAPSRGAEDALSPLRAFWANKLPDTTQLKNSYVNLSTRPFGREELSFSLLVPANWKDTKVAVEPEQLKQDSLNWIPLTLQEAPGEEKSDAVIQVGYIRLDLEMSLCDYVDEHVKANGYVVLLRRQGVYNKRPVDEVLVRWKNQIVRLTFSRHGDLIFAVSGSSLSSDYERYAKDFAAAAVSFTPMGKVSRSFANPMATFSSAGPPRIEFEYPEDWELLEAPDRPAGQIGVEMRVSGLDGEGKTITYGYIYVYGYDKSTAMKPVQAYEDFKKFLENKSVTFHEKTLKADLASDQDEPLSKLEKWAADVKETPVEAAILVLPHQGEILVLGLVVPRREDNVMAWMHSWRIFDMVAGSLAGREIPIAQVKSLTIPSETELVSLTKTTMVHFSQAVQKRDFTVFYDGVSRLLQIQSKPEGMRSAFSGFSDQQEMSLIGELRPVLTNDIRIDHEGQLEVKGYFQTKPEATTFELSYIFEKPEWRLLGINVAMSKDIPGPK